MNYSGGLVGNDADKYSSPEEEVQQLLRDLSEVSVGLNTTHANIVLSSEEFMHKLNNTFADVKCMLLKMASKFKAHILAKAPDRAKSVSTRKITRSARKSTTSSSSKAASGGDSDSDGEPYSHTQTHYAPSSVLPPQQISHYPSRHLQAETSKINLSILVFQCISVLRLFILLCVADLHARKLKIVSIASKSRALSRSMWDCLLNLEAFVLEGARNV